MDVDLRSLKAFLSVVEAGRFSAAARALVSVESTVLPIELHFSGIFRKYR